MWHRWNSAVYEMLKLLVQAASILVSILAAFAIDAWWTDSQEQEQLLGQLETLEVELVQVKRDLSYERKKLEGIRSAIASLLEKTMPEPEETPFEQLGRLLDLSFRHGTIELRSGAVEAMIASGNIGEIDSAELMALLAGWPSRIAELRNQSRLLENDRETLLEYLHPRIPTLEIGHNTGQMEHYPRSSFSGDAKRALSQMEFEGRLGNRAMLAEDSMEIIEGLTKESERMISLIQEER